MPILFHSDLFNIIMCRSIPSCSVLFLLGAVAGRASPSRGRRLSSSKTGTLTTLTASRSRHSGECARRSRITSRREFLCIPPLALPFFPPFFPFFSVYLSNLFFRLLLKIIKNSRPQLPRDTILAFLRTTSTIFHPLALF